MNIPDIKIEEFDYQLPQDKIANFPLPERDQSKLLCLRNEKMEDHFFYELPQILKADSILFFNQTRVIHARLHFKSSSGATIEIFCLEPVEPVRTMEQALTVKGTCLWKCLVGNAKRWRDSYLYKPIDTPYGSVTLGVSIRSKESDYYLIDFSWDPSDITFSEVLSYAGKVPLPPYIHRNAAPEDQTGYQTEYAESPGSVAAPTAGLHFTKKLLERLPHRILFILMHQQHSLIQHLYQNQKLIPGMLMV